MKSITTVRKVASGTGFPLTGFLSIIGLLCLAGAGCRSLPCPEAAPAEKLIWSSFDLLPPGAHTNHLAAGSINFQAADLDQVLQIYQEISGRSVIRPSALPAARISVRNQAALTRVEVLQLLDTALAQNGIAMVLSGEKAVKAVPAATAPMESPPLINRRWQDLPESDSFMSCVIHPKRLKAIELVALLQPLAKTPNAILPVASANELILRDYSSNIRRMLQTIENLDK